jgi:ribosomal protein S27AE
MNNIDLKSLDELDVFVSDGNDQPEFCPKCGGRTEFEQIAEDKQQHKCMTCEYEYFLDIEEL